MKAVSQKVFIVVAVIFINYICILLFLDTHYLSYFLLVYFVGYYLYKKVLSKKFIYILMGAIFASSFLLEFLDEVVYDLYLYFDLQSYYSYFGGEIAYILLFVHSILLFTTALKKNRLQL